ncbi:MAG: hypothetical protein WB785_02845 [Mycobacterium sp.]|uniref:hypothetical protein n=1 Tax=Mycobacterium sp. TaxID=1785 RepID=UPI003C4FBBFF
MASNEAARSVSSSAPVSRCQIAAAYRFLSPHQAAVLDALTDHLLPGTQLVTYVDGLLSRFDAQTVARRVRVADLRDQYTNGIALLDELAAGDFAAVPRLRQDLIVSHAQVAPFISLLFDHIVEAIYAPPENIRCDAADHYHETG